VIRVEYILTNFVKAYLIAVVWIFIFAQHLDIDRSVLLVKSGDDIFENSQIVMHEESKKLLFKPLFHQKPVSKNRKKFSFTPSIKLHDTYIDIFKPPKLT